MESLVTELGLARAELAPGFPRSSFDVAIFQDEEESLESIQVICEHELELVVNGSRVATLMCSRAALRDLVCGFLFNEELIDDCRDIATLTLSADDARAVVGLRRPVRPAQAPVITSGFGGSALIAPSTALSFGSGNAGAYSLPLNASASAPAESFLDAASIKSAVMAMRVAATEYAATRGTHCSALFRDGELLVLREDIGRHNTFDKIAGHCLRHGISPRGALLATTGRVSSEMMRKAQRLGVAGVASLSGPTDAAVRAARRRGTLLAGYVNSSRMTLYAN